MTFKKNSVNLARGFSKSWHHVFVMSITCAFVLTWCLFVGNSRQTTSPVPWHRAPKYGRKLNLHLTMKWFLLKWFLNSCMCRERVCVASCENTVWIQEGRGELWKLQIICTDKTSSGQSARVCCILYAICMACLIWNKRRSCLLHLSKIPDSYFYKMAKTLLVLLCPDFFKIHKSNQKPCQTFFLFFSLIN